MLEAASDRSIARTFTLGSLAALAMAALLALAPVQDARSAQASEAWAVASVGPRGTAASTTTLTTASGHAVTLTRFPRASTVLQWHVGATDPPGAAAQVPADVGSRVSDPEAPMLVATFNGGFKQYSAAGGMVADGTTVSPMVEGMATMAIGPRGELAIGAWHRDGFPSGPVVTARQNLGLLVQRGRSLAGSSITPWGDTLGGVAAPARSAIGLTEHGDVVQAASMSALPSDLAEALLGAGVVTAMQLDINPMWIWTSVAPRPGWPLEAVLAGSNRPANQAQLGWDRDFVAVLARPQEGCAMVFSGPVGAPGPHVPSWACRHPSTAYEGR